MYSILGYVSATGKRISWRTVPVAVPQIEVVVSLETRVARTCRICGPTYITLNAYTLIDWRERQKLDIAQPAICRFKEGPVATRSTRDFSRSLSSKRDVKKQKFHPL